MTSHATDQHIPFVLNVTALGKKFGGRPAFGDISLQLRQGEVVSIIGPSGAGKTTLLRCISLLEKADEGSIEWTQLGIRWTENASESGRQPNPKDLERLHRYVGVVFQGLNLWDDRSVKDNLTLGPRIVLAEDDVSISKRAAQLCERLGIEGLENLWAWQLSGGQRQRVALARALMMRPRVLLLDEITSALDPVLTAVVMDFLTDLRRDGLTMALISHHIEFVATISDRMLFLSSGSILQQGAPSDLLGSPADASIARFLSVVRRVR